MNVLVTGGAGYLGSVLVPKLVLRGHHVTVVDLGYFGLGQLQGVTPRVAVVRDDIRAITGKRPRLRAVLKGMDCVIHLAAISNDPSAELNPALTEEVNYQSTAALAEEAARLKIRLVFSSSCSVYGKSDGEVDEDGSLFPQTVYAESKAKAEAALQDLARPGWRPVILRNGTLFGYSPRMRFDLVVNIFSLYSTLKNEIQLFGGGAQSRPFLHIGDCARAFVHFAERRSLRHSAYNIAHANLRIADIAEVFKRLNPKLRVKVAPGEDADSRDYRVKTTRMELEGFATRVGVDVGAEEIGEAIVSGAIRDPESVFYRNAKWLRQLSEIGSKSHRDLLEMMSHASLMKG
jgi:nucleoside-diphosphate-sugar epimerase